MFEKHVKALNLSRDGCIFNKDFLLRKYKSMKLVYIINKERFVTIKYSITGRDKACS